MSRGRFGTKALAVALAMTMVMSNITVYAADEETVVEVVEQSQESAPESAPAEQESAPASEPAPASNPAPAQEPAPAAPVQETTPVTDPVVTTPTEETTPVTDPVVTTPTEETAPIADPAATTPTEETTPVADPAATTPTEETTPVVDPAVTAPTEETTPVADPAVTTPTEETVPVVDPVETTLTEETTETVEEIAPTEEPVEIVETTTVTETPVSQPVSQPAATTQNNHTTSQPAAAPQKAPAVKVATEEVVETTQTEEEEPAPETEEVEEEGVADLDETEATAVLIEDNEVRAVAEAPVSNELVVNNALAPVASVGGVSYTSVQAAIDAAQEGEIVTLLKDTTENVTITRSTSLDLGGHTLTGDGTNSVITLVNTETKTISATITNGSITGGNGKNGGGINSSNTRDKNKQWINSNTLVLKTLALFDNHAGAALNGLGTGKGDGGAICIEGGVLSLTDVDIHGNTATDGGGAISVDDTVLTITTDQWDENKIYDNSARQGGALNISGISANEPMSGTIENTTFSGNSSTGLGGAIYQATNYGLTITDSTFSGNSAGTQGGAICVYDADLSVSDSTFENNTSPYGGALLIYDILGKNDLNLTNVAMSGNGSTDDKTTGYGGAAYVIKVRDMNVSGGSMTGNKATYGGGMFIWMSNSVTIDNGAQIYNNTATTYGDDLVLYPGTRLNLESASSMNATLDGKAITGWFHDGRNAHYLDGTDEGRRLSARRWSQDDNYDEFTPGDDFSSFLALKAAYAPAPEPMPISDDPDPAPGSDSDPSPSPQPRPLPVPAIQTLAESGSTAEEIGTLVEYGDATADTEIGTLVEYGSAGVDTVWLQASSDYIAHGTGYGIGGAYGIGGYTGDDSMMVVYGASAAMAAAMLALWFAFRRRNG